MLGKKCRFRVTQDPRGERKPSGDDSSPAAQAAAAEIGSLNHLLPLMAETYGVNLVADGYRAEHRPLPALPMGEEWTLYVLLNRYVLPDARWRREGAFLHVRRHTWYEDRLAEIPDRIVRRWATHLRQTGRFSLEDAAALVLTLRDEQLVQFEDVMREAGLSVHRPFSERDEASSRQQRAILRAYGSLLPGQRRLLEAGGWISAAAMQPEARQWLRVALTAGHPGGLSAGSGVPADAPPPTAVPRHGGIPAGVLSLGVPLRSADEDEESPLMPEPLRAVAGGVPTEVLFRYHVPENEPEAIGVLLPRVEGTPL